jgi:LAO/AO transport system kinase
MSWQIEQRVEQILRGESRALAQAITLLESRQPEGIEILKQVFPHTGRATLVGVTGAPGSGKSTLVDCLAGILRSEGCRVGILAIDPSSPFSGGALLGDRVRMQCHASDPGIFIRSMATRGALGGLAAATHDAALLLDAAGMQFLLIETVGTGQEEVDVARLTDATLLLLVPGWGDDVQALKAGVMEIADIFVLNKSDHQGADRLEEQVRAALSLAVALPSEPPAWQPPLVRTVATRGEGVAGLVSTLRQFLDVAQQTGSFQAKRHNLWRQRILEIMRDRMVERVLPSTLENNSLKEKAEEVAARRSDPYSAAEEIFEQAGWNATGL